MTVFYDFKSQLNHANHVRYEGLMYDLSHKIVIF